MLVLLILNILPHLGVICLLVCKRQGVCFGSGYKEINSIVVRKAWQKEKEAAGHIVSAAKVSWAIQLQGPSLVTSLLHLSLVDVKIPEKKENLAHSGLFKDYFLTLGHKKNLS